MKVTVNITKSFSAAAKPLFKKYRSFSKDLHALEKQLNLTPKLEPHLVMKLLKFVSKSVAKEKVKVVVDAL